ncbi:MAG: DUF1801 domain-containing protein [Chloroflexi bacterium]|nr:DUF1801 domain-containing protein [Chloroflexota bacterium]
MAEKTVDGYVKTLSGWQADAVTQVRQLLKEAAPDASESIKWAQPVYESNGPFAYIKAHKNSVNFGFWRGAELPDPLGLLEGDGEKMRHVKLTSAEGVNKKAFQDFVKAALELNKTQGDPTKRKK